MIIESKKFINDDGLFYYKKYKIYFYKEDFYEFKENVNEMIQYIIDEKGEEVISECYQKDYKKDEDGNEIDKVEELKDEIFIFSFIDIEFDDI